MQKRQHYPAGVPSWIDLEAPDPEAATRFYGGLFGWEFEDRIPPEIPAHYFIARLDGQTVAGIGSRPPEAAGRPVAWNTYVSVESADDAAHKVEAAGGRVVSGPVDVGPGGDAGRIVLFTDPAGALLGAVEPRLRTGAEAVNQPGTWSSSDLNVRDIEGAKAFYGEVFGWVASKLDLGAGEAWMWQRPGYAEFLEKEVDPDIPRRHAELGAPPGFSDAIGWMEQLTEDRFPADAEPHWSVTFLVSDTDAVTENAVKLGGTIVVPPMDAGPTVRLAVLRDPQGARFTVSRFQPEG